MNDLIVVGGGFAGVTAAREAALRGRSVLLEARERLGGRTWTAPWNGSTIEYGGAWVHWHQPHTWSEITRAGLRVAVSDSAGVAGWYVGAERRSGSIEERDEIARRGWDRFVDGVREALPVPTTRLARSARSRVSIGRRSPNAWGSWDSATRSMTSLPPSSSRSLTLHWTMRARCPCSAGTPCRAIASS